MTDIVDENSPIDDSVFEAPSTAKEPEVHESDTTDTQNVVGGEAKGYKTYDEWIKNGRDPDEFKGRKAYEKEGERFKALMTLQQEQKLQREALSKMWEYNKRIEESAKKTAIEELKAQTLAATAVGDVPKVAELTDKLSRLHEARTAEQPVYTPEVNKDLNPDQLFSQTNPWFSNPQSEADFAKIGFVKMEDQRMVSEGLNKQMDMGQYLGELSRRVNSKFAGPIVRKSTPVLPAVSDGIGGMSDARQLLDSLPTYHKNMVATLKRANKNFSTADLKRYVTQVKQLGEIK